MNEHGGDDYSLLYPRRQVMMCLVYYTGIYRTCITILLYLVYSAGMMWSLTTYTEQYILVDQSVNIMR